MVTLVVDTGGWGSLLSDNAGGVWDNTGSGSSRVVDTDGCRCRCRPGAGGSHVAVVVIVIVQVAVVVGEGVTMVVVEDGQSEDEGLGEIS